ncbi:hypothetical protein [Flavobacterium sp. UBA7682]|uniref:hypothetical protein n=1 Tax=Flavobacterium sp. UBA7682 TaxID=1946560 RepID=UPI0025BFC579|nr:hypothetical protein [Flavobacterium sp. UBA7682]
MYLKRFLLPIWLLFANLSFAQHCGWDGTYMFSVKVTDSTGNPIENLKLTLLDSIGNPMVIKDYSKYYQKRFEGYGINDTLIFNQNLTEIKNTDNDYKTRHLKIAKKDYYLFVPYAYSENKSEFYQIRIEDPSKRFYSNVGAVFTDAIIGLCADYRKNTEDKKVTFTLSKRKEYLFSQLKLMDVIKDKQKIKSLEEKTDYPKYKNFFVANYIDQTNTNFVGLFQKKGSKCLVYCLTYNTEISINDFDNNRLTFNDGYHFGSREHFEATNTFGLVNLKTLQSVSFKTFIKDENWSEDGGEDLQECTSTIEIINDKIIIKKSHTPNYIKGFEGDCIEEGDYKITKEKLIKL